MFLLFTYFRFIYISQIKKNNYYISNYSLLLIIILYFTKKTYQDPPPPPPEPPPEEPPPEDPPPELLLDGLDDIAVVAEAIVVLINVPNVCVLNPAGESYQSGACRAMLSNWLIHVSDTPKAYVYGKIL